MKSDSSTVNSEQTGFLNGGGEMGERIRAFDWSKTILGPISKWPSHLKTAVNLVLQSPVPLALLWGREGVMIYNEGYAAFSGARHPSIFGQPVLEAWPEIPDFINEFMGKCFSGENWSLKDQHLVLHRQHVPEDVWIDLNYSPVMDEEGQPAGVFAVVIETTQRVLAEQKQKQAEDRFQLAMGAAGMIGTWDWHIQTDVFYSDARFAVLFSVDPEKGERGTSLSEYIAGIHPDDVERIETAIQHTIATGEKYSQEYRLLQKDGTIRWIIARGECLYDKAGKPWRFPGAVVDITERKQAEEAFQESEERFRTMANSIPQLAWMTQPDGWIYWYNQRWYDFTGTNLEEMQGWGWTKVHHPDHADRIVKSFGDAVKAGEPWEDTFPLRGKDGKYRWFLSRALPLRDETGQIVRWFGTNTDITDQLEIEAALKRSETRLIAYSAQQGAMADFGLQAIAGLEDLAKITRIAVKMVAETLETGYSKIIQRVPGTENDLHFLAVYGFEQELVGQVFDPGAEPHAAYTLEALEPVVVDDIYRETRFKASPFHYEHGLTSGAAVIIYANNKPFGVLEVDSKEKRHFTDAEVNFLQTAATLIGTVVERKQGEEALARQNILVEDYARRLEVSNKDLDQFASIASHDLQAPLRKVMMFSDFLSQQEADKLSEEGKNYIKRMQSSVNKMQTLITDLLSLSRVDRSGGKAYKTIDLTSIVSKVRDELYPDIKETNATIDIGSFCTFEADEPQIAQVLANLIGNAIKYRREGVAPSIKVNCEKVDNHCVQLTVTDNGIGIKPEHYGKIFEIFQRLHNESQYSGTGIGLAIVKRIVDRHHGTIRVESTPGEGSRFIVSLPVKQFQSATPV